MKTKVMLVYLLLLCVLFISITNMACVGISLGYFLVFYLRSMVVMV